MKTIFRTNWREHFTMLPNALMRDKTLTFRARGILCMALSHSEEWVVTKAWVEEQTPEGREAIKTAFRELEQAGYAVLTEQRDMLGKITSKTWTFYDKPVPENERSNFTSVQTTGSDTEPKLNGHELPCSGLPACGEPAAKKTMLSENQGKEPMPAPEKKRMNNPVFDAIAEVSGFNLDEINGSTGGMIAKARKDILESTPDVSRDEIFRRAHLLRERWPTATVTPTSLAKWWAQLSDNPSGVSQQQRDLQRMLANQ